MSQDIIFYELAEFIVGLRYSSLPTPVIKQANRCFIDLLGCIFGAMSIKENHKIIEYALMVNPANEATLWGTGRLAGVAETALAMGCLGYHLEYDDGISLGGHWGSSSIPAAVAMSEYCNSSGEELLSAIVIGYEIGNRISRVFSPTLLKRGVHFPFCMGAIASAAASAKLMKLDVIQTAKTLGNSCMLPIAPYGPAFSGDSIKDVYSGYPNLLGIQMARLARSGYGGPPDLIEQSAGLASLFGQEDLKNLKKTVLDSLGGDYQILKTYFKPYPCCRWLHAPILAVQKLKKKCELEVNQIESVIVEGPEFIHMYDTRGDFSQKIKAMYSMPYVVAAALISTDVGIEQFHSSFANSPQIKRVIEKITIKTDERLTNNFPDYYQTRVTISLVSGKQLQEESALPWGPDMPATDEDILLKFGKLMALVYPESKIKEFTKYFKCGIESDQTLRSLKNLLHDKIINN